MRWLGGGGRLWLIGTSRAWSAAARGRRRRPSWPSSSSWRRNSSSRGWSKAPIPVGCSCSRMFVLQCTPGPRSSPFLQGTVRRSGRTRRHRDRRRVGHLPDSTRPVARSCRGSWGCTGCHWVCSIARYSRRRSSRSRSSSSRRTRWTRCRTRFHTRPASSNCPWGHTLRDRRMSVGTRPSGRSRCRRKRCTGRRRDSDSVCSKCPRPRRRCRRWRTARCFRRSPDDRSCRGLVRIAASRTDWAVARSRMCCWCTEARRRTSGT